MGRLVLAQVQVPVCFDNDRNLFELCSNYTNAESHPLSFRKLVPVRFVAIIIAFSPLAAKFGPHLKSIHLADTWQA